MESSAYLTVIVFNLACGFAQNTGQLVALRFLSGLGGSAPLSVSQLSNHTSQKHTYNNGQGRWRRA